MMGSTDAADSSERRSQNAVLVVAPAPPKRQKRVLRTVVHSVTVAVVVVLILWAPVVTFVAGVYSIPSESMSPTLNAGGHVVVNKLAYRFSSPQPGDVIVFKGPAAWNVGYKSIRSANMAVRWVQNVLSFIGIVPPDENDLAERIIAVGGQTVECRNSTGLTVDGKPVYEPFLNTKTMGVENFDPAVYRCLGPEFGPVKVPEASLWVMDDHRTHSADSRAHCTSVPADLQRGVLCPGGTVPIENIVGKVW
jgi:signal peptidase I